MNTETTNLNTNPSFGPAKFIDTAETSKFIRTELKRAFPGVKFSVRLSRYSGGSSIYVKWTDGPTKQAVEKIVGGLSGSGFDGMIDLKFSHYHWLNSDGSVTYAGTLGTYGNRGTVPPAYHLPKTPEATLVHLHSDYLFFERTYTQGLVSKMAEAFTEKYGREITATASDFGGAHFDIPLHSTETHQSRNGWEFTAREMLALSTTDKDGGYVLEEKDWGKTEQLPEEARS